MQIAVLGGTGSFGQALVQRLSAAGGDQIVIGSRDASRADECARQFESPLVSGTTNQDAAERCDLVVLAVRADSALETTAVIAGVLCDQPLFTVTSNLKFVKGVGAFPDRDPRSLAERIQDLVDVPVVAGLHSIAAASLTGAPPNEDALVCGDDEQAKAVGIEFAGKLVAGRALDAGPLASARALEGMTAVIVNLNRRYRSHAGIRVTGLQPAVPGVST
jgi:8-hydroxy-5-deazaflavin:NADPH oxidoreductase